MGRHRLNLQPSEFWAMTMREMIVECEFTRPHDPLNDYAGGLNQGQIDELEEMLRDGT